jgi:hypothetical protein
MNTNLLLGQFIRIIHEKAKRAKLYKVKISNFFTHIFYFLLKNYIQSRILLTHAIDILGPLHHQDMAIGALIKYLRYDRLLFDLYEAISRQTFLDNDNNLWDACQSFLSENHLENGEYVVLKPILIFSSEFSPNK